VEIRNEGKSRNKVDVLAKVCVRKEDGGLGFRELHHFNIAMLTKTGWNMLTRPKALVSKLFQAHY